MQTSATGIFESIFKGLDASTLDTLRRFAKLRSYPEQTTLCHQGTIEHTFYVIVEGRVAIVQELEGGEERLLAVRGPREYFGELGLLDTTPRMANCITLTPTKVLEITEEVFDEVVEQSPAVALGLTRHVLEMLRAHDRQAIEDLVDKNEQLQAAYRRLQEAQAELVEKERLERELEIAADVQRTLLPARLPTYRDYHVAALLQPARQVGGDFYDALDLDERHLALLLADVADKNVHAALYMAVARTLFKVESRRSLRPADVALAVHREICDVNSSAEIFLTAFYGVLDRLTGQLTYIVAGHERPLVVRSGRSVSELPGKGRFLGMIESLELDEYAVKLRAGDRLVLFSDGVTDALSADGRQYGHRRLRAFLEAHGNLPADQLVNGLAADVTRWRGNESPFDDLTVMVLEATQDNGSIPRAT